MVLDLKCFLKKSYLIIATDAIIKLIKYSQTRQSLSKIIKNNESASSTEKTYVEKSNTTMRKNVKRSVSKISKYKYFESIFN